MALSRYKLGELIKVVDERNTYGIKDFYGINIDKEFMPTVANTEGLDESNYKVVRENRFVFSGMQTGRDECIRIGMYLGKTPIIVSPAYTTFEINATDAVLPTYFFMIFLSKEKDRLGWFYSDGSIRSNLDWDRFCDMELNLPDLPTQQKYVDIYKAMVANQQCYERGLEDLKLGIDAVVDEIKHKSETTLVRELLKEVDVRNESGEITIAHGINIAKQFMPSVADINGVDLTKYKLVEKNQFAFSGMQTGRDECIRIALNKAGTPIIISPAYTVFERKNDTVLEEYILMWFSRGESDRRGWFMSDSSIRSNLDLDRFYETQLPIPDKDVQKSIVDIYNVYTERKRINEQLKSQIKNICPILTRGSLEENLDKERGKNYEF
ncbi:MAG: restriction endonuclease subunit S [Opitutales bacterium]|nr:restriction endonuclease subunit S [Opitutales bacterium]